MTPTLKRKKKTKLIIKLLIFAIIVMITGIFIHQQFLISKKKFLISDLQQKIAVMQVENEKIQSKINEKNSSPNNTSEIENKNGRVFSIIPKNN